MKKTDNTKNNILATKHTCTMSIKAKAGQFYYAPSNGSGALSNALIRLSVCLSVPCP